MKYHQSLLPCVAPSSFMAFMNYPSVVLLSRKAEYGSSKAFCLFKVHFLQTFLHHSCVRFCQLEFLKSTLLWFRIQSFSRPSNSFNSVLFLEFLLVLNGQFYCHSDSALANLLTPSPFYQFAVPPKIPHTVFFWAISLPHPWRSQSIFYRLWLFQGITFYISACRLPDVVVPASFTVLRLPAVSLFAVRDFSRALFLFCSTATLSVNLFWNIWNKRRKQFLVAVSPNQIPASLQATVILLFLSGATICFASHFGGFLYSKPPCDLLIFYFPPLFVDFLLCLTMPYRSSAVPF